MSLKKGQEHQSTFHTSIKKNPKKTVINIKINYQEIIQLHSTVFYAQTITSMRILKMTRLKILDTLTKEKIFFVKVIKHH